MVEKVGITADKEQLDLQDSEIELREQQERDDVNSVMASGAGQRYMYRLLKRFTISQLMTGNSFTHFNLGIEQCRKSIEADLMATCPKEYFKMQIDGIEDLKDAEKRGIKTAVG